MGFRNILKKLTEHRSVSEQRPYSDTQSDETTQETGDFKPEAGISGSFNRDGQKDGLFWLNEYRQWIIDQCGAVQILDMDQPLSLDDLYIPIQLAQLTDTGPHPEATADRFTDIDDQVRIDEAWQHRQTERYLTPEEALAELRHMAVVGDPGAGKTTLLRNLALRLARNETDTLPQLPLLVDLHSLSRSQLLHGAPLETLLVTWLAQEVASVISPRGGTDAAFEEHLAQWFDEKLLAGEVTLLLDGLDEVAGAGQDGEGPFHVVSRLLNVLDQRYAETPVLLTCRRAHIGRFVNIPKSFSILEVRRFEWEHVCRFADVWFRDDQQTSATLKDQLNRNARIRGLTSNPLLLALICITFQRRGALPQRRADVYRRCVDVLLAEWDAARTRDRCPRFTLENKEDLLRRVAWHFHMTGRRYMKREELVNSIRSFLPMIRLKEEDAEPILDEISAHHGLLKDFGHAWYGFHHFTLQEHFAMEHVTSPQRLDEAVTLRNRSWWREVIRLYSGKGDCTELICMLSRQKEDVFQSNLFLIGECLAEGSPVHPGAMQYAMDELSRIARNTAKPVDVRIRAADLVSILLSSEDVDIFLRWINDDHVPVEGRRQMAQHFRHDYDPDVLDSMADLLTSARLDMDIREALASSIAAAAGPDELPGYIARLANEADAAARQSLALTMGRISVTSIDALADAIADESLSEHIRQGLTIALGCGRDEEYHSLLKTIWKTSPEHGLKAAAVVGLAATGYRKTVEKLPAVITDPDTENWIRTQAVEILIYKERGAAEKPLFKIVADSSRSRNVRVYMAEILGEIADRTTAKRLVDMVRDETEDRFVRVALLKGLGQNRQASLAEELTQALTDTGIREYVRRSVIDALGCTGGEAAYEPLLALWQSSSEQKLRERALLGLGTLGTPSALRFVLDALADGSIDRTVRRNLADTLRPGSDQKENEQILELIIGRLRQTDMQASYLAAVARFASAVGRSVYPEDVGMPAIEYAWSRFGPCGAYSRNQ